MAKTPSASETRLAELQAERDALVARLIGAEGETERQRRRLQSILTRLAPLDSVRADRRPPPSIGQRVGAALDLAIYGLADRLGLRRAQARERVRFASEELQRGNEPCLPVVVDPSTGEVEPDWPPRNLFTDRATRQTVQGLTARLIAFAADNGPVQAMIAMNFHAGGGADAVALATVRVVADHGVVAVLLTDPGPRLPMPDLPDNVVILDLEATGPLDELARQAIVFALVQAAAPRVLHVVNSDAAWRMVRACPPDLLEPTRVIATLFALQFDGAGLPEGYAARHLPQAAPMLDLLLTDNLRFASEGPDRVGATMASGRIRVIPSACRLEGVVTAEEAAGRLAARTRSGERLTVVWAGRLDAEKRVGLLADIAAAMADRADFRVFGQPVLDHPTADLGRLRALPNVRLMGAYDQPTAWEEPAPAPHVFLFTSVWEGMPNTLVEAAWLGLPVVATDVGGVSDLIDADTGWPIPAEAGAAAYVAALDTVRDDVAETLSRTSRLIARAHARHTHAAFEAGVREAYGLDR